MRFSTLELQQLAAMAAGGLFVLLLFVLLVRWLRKLAAIWPETAKKLGLSFRENDRGSRWLGSTSASSKIIEGVLAGVPVRLAATLEVVGRTRRAQTIVSAVAREPGPPFTVQIQKGARRPQARFHAITVGDAHFDGKVVLSGEQPDAVRARLDPTVRDALLAVPIDELALRVHQTDVTLSCSLIPETALQLEALIRAVAAIAALPPHAAREAVADRSSPAPQAAPPRDAYLVQLAEGFGFTLEQLAANRAGAIHESQRKKVGLGCGPFVAIFLTLASVAGGGGGAFAYYEDCSKPLGRLDWNAVYLLSGAGGVLGLIFLVVTIFAFRGAARRREAYLGAPVVIEGPAQKVHISGQHETFKVNVGGQSFYTPKKGWELVTQSARYRVYSVHGELLSLEPAL